MHNRLKFFLAIIISILMIFFCVYAYPSLKESAQADILGDAIKERAAKRFSGVITLWQIDSFEGGINSRATWLSNTLTKLEKRYNGVYFTVKSVTQELLYKLLESGTPDVILFGNGVFTKSQAQEYFTAPEGLQSPLVPALKKSGEGLAYPIFFGGYCMLTDKEFTSKSEYKQGLREYLNSDFGYVYRNKQKVKVSSLAAGSYNTSLVPLALYLGDGLSCEVDTFNPDALWDRYNYDKLCASAMVSQRQLYRLSAATQKEKGRKSAILPLYPYTDMVQYAAIFKGATDAKLKVIMSALEYLTSTEAQLTLDSIGLMPANVTALSSIEYTNGFMQQLCDFYRSNQIKAPSAFASTEGINSAALKALRGDKGALEDFVATLYQ